jgi:hypothetical protein
MLGPAFAAIRSHIESNYTALPVRWANELWGDINPQQMGQPFVELEIIGGTNYLRGFSKVGNRLWIHSGLIRFYIFAPLNIGMGDAIATADDFALFMERTEFGQVPALGQTIRTLDFSTNDNVAMDEAGNYSVLMASVPFDFYYTA